MTFREQQRTCLVAAALSLAALVAIVGPFHVREIPLESMPLGLRILRGGMEFVFGVSFFCLIGRGVHRWFWLNVYRQPQATLLDERVERMYVDGWQSPFWRTWMWLDEAGNDRDARP